MELTHGQYCLRLVLDGHTERPRWPVAMKNRVTGKVAYRVYRPGDGNTSDVAIEVDDEATLVHYVTVLGYGVRVAGPRSKTPSIIYPHCQRFVLH